MRLTKLIGGIAILLVVASSCVTPKEVNYLADLDPELNMPLNSKFEAVIYPHDELRISVIGVGDEKELAEPFNPFGSVQGGNQNNYRGYLVDMNGDIQFPAFGTMHVQGMTRLQLQETIRRRLIEEGHMNDPMVDVRFSNFRVYILGASDGGHVLTIDNERCTFLEALAMAGGLNKYTRRDHIAVMREIDGKLVTHYLDPRSREVYYDPFFFLQQNDIIVTQSHARFYLQDAFNTTVGVVSTVASLISTVVMIYVLANGK